MAQQGNHGGSEQSIGGQGTVDGIAGSRSGTEGASNGAGIDQGVKPGASRQAQQDRDAARQGGPAGPGQPGEPGHDIADLGHRDRK
jgi:hypothetical protein